MLEFIGKGTKFILAFVLIFSRAIGYVLCCCFFFLLLPRSVFASIFITQLILLYIYFSYIVFHCSQDAQAVIEKFKFIVYKYIVYSKTTKTRAVNFSLESFTRENLFPELFPIPNHFFQFRKADEAPCNTLRYVSAKRLTNSTMISQSRCIQQRGNNLHAPSQDKGMEKTRTEDRTIGLGLSLVVYV